MPPKRGFSGSKYFHTISGGSLLFSNRKGDGQAGVHYHQRTAEWNKNMVKRILENAKYTGADGYPRLVSNGDFTAAQGQRAERNTYAPLPVEIRPIQAKTVCGLCGGKLTRGARSHGRVHWKCQNPDCGQSTSLGDEVLAQLVTGRLRELAQAPHLITAPEPQRGGLDMDTVRLQNELTLAFNRGDENPGYIKTLALAAAAQRYNQLPDPTPAHDLEQIRARLEYGPADTEVLAALLAVAVRAVRLAPDKTVELELVNGKIITEKEESA